MFGVTCLIEFVSQSYHPLASIFLVSGFSGWGIRFICGPHFVWLFFRDSFAVKTVGYAQGDLFCNVGGFSTPSMRVCRSVKHGISIVCTYILWVDGRMYG